MKAILLAAGLGTRLRPFTLTVPKCLTQIGGRPLLDYWVEMLAKAGVRDILVNTHHLPEQFDAYARRATHPASITLVREPKLLGTAGTLLANQAFFGEAPVLLAHADNLSFFDVRAFIRAFETRPPSAAMTMMTFRSDSPKSCGIVELDAEGMVVALHEKVANPPGNLANAAIYIVTSEIVRFVASLGSPFVDMSTQVLPRFIGRISTWDNTTYHRDIGTPESLARARADIGALSASGRLATLLAPAA